jgi:hypothetical protein
LGSVRTAKLHEAEPILLEAWVHLRDDPGLPPPAAVGSDRKLDTLRRIVRLYRALHEVEPGRGWGDKADRWDAASNTGEVPPDLLPSATPRR